MCVGIISCLLSTSNLVRLVVICLFFFTSGDRYPIKLSIFFFDFDQKRNPRREQGVA